MSFTENDKKKTVFEIEEINADNSKSPFYCFDNDVSDIENLNFNNLKKCTSNKTFTKDKFFVLHSKKDPVDTWFQNFNINSYGRDKNFSFQLIKKTPPATITFNGQMLKIFHKEYKPTNTN